MIAATAWLLTCQLLGEILARAFALPLPGPVAGMGLMFIFLVIQGRKKREDDRVPAAIGRVADTLLGNLSLLFVPAAVGVVQYLDVLKRFGWVIALSIGVSTAAALLATVFIFRLGVKLQTHFRRQGVAEESLKSSRS